MAILTETTKLLKDQMSISNVHAVPRIEKVVVNVGIGKNREDKELHEAVQKDLATITGQKPHERRARKAIAGFKIRVGNVIGYRVTLRGKRMEDFVTRFVGVTLPRVRDFRGLSEKSLDAQGNLSVGLREHLAFPEVHSEQTDRIFGVEATFVTSSKSREDARSLFDALGFPFRKKEDEATGI